MSNLLNNLKSFVGLKSDAKVKTLSPKQASGVYADKLEASDSVKGEAQRLMEQGLVTQRAVKGNLDKATVRKQAEQNDQNALTKLMTDLEVIAVEVVANQEKTKVLHEEASVLEKSNTEVVNVLSGTSFAQILAATKAAKATAAPQPKKEEVTNQTPTTAKPVKGL